MKIRLYDMTDPEYFSEDTWLKLELNNPGNIDFSFSILEKSGLVKNIIFEGNKVTYEARSSANYVDLETMDDFKSFIERHHPNGITISIINNELTAWED